MEAFTLKNDSLYADSMYLYFICFYQILSFKFSIISLAFIGLKQINFSQTRWKFLGSNSVSLHTGLVGGFTSRFEVYVLVKLEIYWEGFSPKNSAGSLRDLQEDHGCLYCVL